MHKSSAIYILLVSVIFQLVACNTNDDSNNDTNQTASNKTETIDPSSVQTYADVSLVAACSGCHGKDGVTSKPDAPFLAGQTSVYLEIAMSSYLSGERTHDVMREAVVDLTAEQRIELGN